MLFLLLAAPFYVQRIDGPVPVVASAKVRPEALHEAESLMRRMLVRPEVTAALALNGARVAVMAHDELTTDLPEQANLKPKPYWDKRTRGLGGTRQSPVVSCGEENLLNLPGDPYEGESIFVHELAHAVHEVAMPDVDPTFEARLAEAYAAAMREGLWKGAYAAADAREYWAEGAQSWFDANTADVPRDRAALKLYDPRLAALLEEVFGDGDWRWSPRQRPPAPRFAWPEGLLRLFEAYEAAEKGGPLPEGWTALEQLREAARSSRSAEPSMALFVNAGAEPAPLDWIDDNGERRSYGVVAPGRSVWQETYDGHVFSFGRRFYRAGAQPGRALIP